MSGVPFLGSAEGSQGGWGNYITGEEGDYITNDVALSRLVGV